MSKSDAIRDYAKRHLGGPYIYGATGQVCTPAYRRARQAQYPNYAESIARYCPVLSGKQSSCAGCKYNGRLAHDCAQLTRKAAEAAGLSLPSGAKSQYTKAGWERKGSINDLPPGEVAFLYNVKADGSIPHTGIALGDGTEIDARGHASGVVQMPMGKYPWTHWAQLPGMAGDEGGEVQMVYKTGSQGQAVKSIQQMLMQVGYSLPLYGADGKYGAETEKAVKGYQRMNSLEPTGEVDEALMIKLEADSLIRPEPAEPSDTVSITLPRSAAVALLQALKEVV